MILLSPEETCDELNRSHKPGQTFYIPERLPKDGYYGSIAKATAKKILEWLEENGIWAQVPFAVSETEKTMWCILEKDWEELKKEI